MVSASASVSERAWQNVVAINSNVAIRKILFLIYLNIYPVANINKISEIAKDL